jgi:hypothetical protein
MNLRRTAFAASAVVAATLSPAMVSAQPFHSSAPVKTTTVNPATWTMTSDNCPNLPAGTVLTATGSFREVRTVTVGQGATTDNDDSESIGYATDQNGNWYRWTYKNTSGLKNSVAAPNVFTGWMKDSFRLGKGSGPLRLENGFVADIVDNRDTGAFSITPRSSYGDPFNFPYGPGKCDPL